MWSFLKAPMVRLRIGRRVFVPSVLATLLVLGLMPVLLSLGHWQLARGSEKAQRALLYAERGRAQPVDAHGIAALARSGEDIRYRAVALTGEYENRSPVLLDNQPSNGRPGYHVLTPFLTQGRRILVDRGWVPADPDRKRLPGVEVVSGRLTIQGRVYVPEAGFRAGDSVLENRDFPLRVQALDFTELGSVLGGRLEPYVVQLDAAEPHGYLREWRPAGLNPERHFGYALQWFALAGLLSILYFAVNWRREE